MTREEMVTLLERYDKLKPKNAKFVVRPVVRHDSWGIDEKIDFNAYKLHKTKKEGEWEDFVCTLLTVNLLSDY